MKHVLLVLLLLSMPACHAPVTITTPQGQAAYTADQVAVRVNELQNAAIAAEANGGLPTATTRTIVSFAVSGDKILAQAPAGWQLKRGRQSLGSAPASRPCASRGRS